MRYRANFLPRACMDLCATLFLLAAIGITFVCEVALVLPSLSDGPLYWVQAALGVFIVYNILGNIFAAMRVDTSTHGLLLPASLKPEWRFCSACEATAPPRSWHCPTCNACILKRDHHCMFTGYCVGHFNMRYFLLFLAYLALGALYATVLNSIFIVKVVGGFHLLSLLQLVMPTAMLVFGIDVSVKQLYAFLFTLDLVGFLFVFAMLLYHGEGAVKGATNYEKAHRQFKYNLGWRDNLRQVFGTRWRVAWLSPTVHSPLPSDGISFHTTEQWRLEGAKQR
ncbi:probable palmitoyltransferase ZDHHC24 [Pollicipes pollicipes]|uniref:probable palmitoyltransferase ZDHHC24 n=1 Tax=Pollicipes pollicipes TaxID=41117 RepID=UPI0018849551|nr:probable palmitoyltransferase ZDHHC24 [Pollicipes pollicipes]XP_037080286.1 probable palmitoyltransferase ZDHHC24 [Pollicipes pollicipes]XP_037080287.1 probable palmitoyltransferase ZDHHC24 [Pollicipes pollicipes]XP_037080288.1 probable palmitoyltransferase ZDHHC24 [Pollicipes pollicipes]